MVEFLYAALAAKFGIVLSVSDPNKARQRLYQERTKAGDPELARLQFRISPVNPTSELWILKGPADGKEEQTAN